MASDTSQHRPEPGVAGAADHEDLQTRIHELVEERRRLVRQRRIHLALLGLAVSLPIHIAIIIWLSLNYKVLPAGPAGPTPVVLDLSILPDETLQDMLEPLETEDMLTPELEIDPGDDSLALELDQTFELPQLEIARGAAGLSTEIGGDGLGSGMGLGAGQGAGTAFFGIQARGNRFAYIVDISGSMGNNGRLQLAMRELKRSLEALPDFAQFKIALYSNQVTIPPFQRGWLRASRDRVRATGTWLDSIPASGGTEPFPAFQYLWSDDERPDVVFFLTDGEIPGGTGTNVIMLNQQAGGKPAVVNCIAFSADASQAELREIALRTEGVFRYVPEQGARP
jgi:hypothetical protein